MEDGTIDGPGEEPSNSANHCCKFAHFVWHYDAYAYFQLTESERSAETCRCICEGKDIPFFRFSPKLNVDIFFAEPNLEKLFSMIVQVKSYMRTADCEQLMNKLLTIVHQLDTSFVELDARYDAVLTEN